jgi:hypothetical protein
MQRADTHVYIRVYAIDESRHCGRGTETIIAAAARQFSIVIWDRTHDPRSERKTYNTICIPVPSESMRLIHCGNVDMPVCAMYEPNTRQQSCHQFRSSLAAAAYRE